MCVNSGKGVPRTLVGVMYISPKGGDLSKFEENVRIEAEKSGRAWR